MKRTILIWLLTGSLLCCLTGCGENQEASAAVQEQRADEVDKTKERDDELESESECKSEGESESGTESKPENEPEVTIVMVGDILLHTPVAESGLREDGTYNFDALFSHVKADIEAADLALVNEEVIIGGRELNVTGYPSFNAPYELGDALVDAGFDVVLHATNHALDKGRRGLKNCLGFWREQYPEVMVLGINGSEEEQEQLAIYEQDGIRITLLNYTYGTNGIPLPEGMPYAVNLLEEERVTADLQKAEEEADFVIVCPHWGTEYMLEPTAEQKRWTALFWENGADLVIGTHPHVIEPVEWYDGGEEEAGMLVYYSLGNFVNWTSGTGEGVSNRMVGCMAEVTIGLEESGEAVIKDYEAKPLVCHVEEGTDAVTVYFLEEYTEELAERNAIRKQDSAFSLEYCETLWENVITDKETF